jgi:kynurenine formamidase
MEVAMNNNLDPITELAHLLGKFDLVDLSHTLQEGIPSFPTHSKFFHMPWPQPNDPALMYQILMHEHNGTHVDAPAHFIRGDIDPEHHWMHTVAPDRLLAPCNILDFSASPPEELLELERVKAWEGTHHKIASGDIVIFNFGVHKRWALGEAGWQYAERWPGLARDTSEYLAKIGVKAVGTDTLGLDASGSTDIPAHDTLLVRGILIMENLTNLDNLPPRCFLLAIPLKIYEGTASPIRALALIPKGD